MAASYDDSVTLTWAEVTYAAIVGVFRQVQNLRKAREDKNGAPKDKGWQFHLDGACAEAAYAKWRDVFWGGNLGDLDAADVGKAQVRATRLEHGCLLLHDDDDNEAAYHLMVGAAPHFRVAGWIKGADGKRREWWKDPVGGRPCYFVPQSALHEESPVREQR